MPLSAGRGRPSAFLEPSLAGQLCTFFSTAGPCLFSNLCLKFLRGHTTVHLLSSLPFTAVPCSLRPFPPVANTRFLPQLLYNLVGPCIKCDNMCCDVDFKIVNPHGMEVSHWRACHFAGTPSSSLWKSLLKGERGAAE